MTWQLTKVIIALALVLFLGLFWWLPDALVEPAMKLAGSRSKEPDYWVESFTITAMGEDGRPRYVLHADSLTHYPGDTSTRVERPHVVQYEKGQPPIVTDADKGLVSPDGKKLLMTGNVRVARGPEGNAPAGEVSSHEVTVTLN